MKKKTIVAGHICIDITPVFPDDAKKVAEISELFGPSKLIHVSTPDIHTGGAVANTGLGMKKLGADVRLMGKVGNDVFGSIIRDILRQNDAGNDLIVEDGEITSYSIVVAPPGIDRTFMHCTGANDSFDGTEIPESALEDIALFHFGYPTLMRKMYEDEGVRLSALLQRVKKKGIATSLDMAEVEPGSEAGMLDWKKILTRALPFVDFFEPSFKELCFMIDRTKYEELVSKAGNEDIEPYLSIEYDIEPLARMCLKMGAGSVLIKCGAKGLYFMASTDMDKTGKRLELCADEWNGFCGFEKSYRIDRVLSGTGAGDTCIAAFLASILEGAGPKEAMENAAATGALCCMSVDAVSGLPKLSDVRNRINAGWEKAW